ARPGSHVAHAAALALFSQVEPGTMCPWSMTYAAVPVLRDAGAIGAPWVERILRSRYEATLRPVAEKAGVMVGMAMTEKQGGSDVRANATRAEPTADEAWRLTGHKWFCSAPMSDGFLTLAYAPGGLSCFLVPRITQAGERNAIRLMRLKEKLGNRSNASAEIEYEGAEAHLLGGEGEGVRTIIDMVHHTRLGTAAGALGIMRAALAEAVHHAEHRTAFQKRLVDLPLMARVLADLALDYEAAAALVMHVASAFDAEDGEGRAYARLAVALAKFWVTKRCPAFTAECLEALGGAGYIEEGPMPRLFRESPLNAIWEGSGNVIALDVLRTLRRAPQALERLAGEAQAVRGADRRLDAAWGRALALARDPAAAEGDGRRLAEALALALQATLLVRHAPAAVADGFVTARLGEDRSLQYGASTDWDAAPVLERQRA
ncbi:MAG: acyl-CoA dehydrogenase family protein, partial [Caulobacteraceae bacterium]|nr:acyl-CoA dehydrogenase family protein [Caulobacter sp.]